MVGHQHEAAQWLSAWGADRAEALDFDCCCAALAAVIHRSD